MEREGSVERGATPAREGRVEREATPALPAGALLQHSCFSAARLSPAWPKALCKAFGALFFTFRLLLLVADQEGVALHVCHSPPFFLFLLVGVSSVDTADQEGVMFWLRTAILTVYDDRTYCRVLGIVRDISVTRSLHLCL